MTQQIEKISHGALFRGTISNIGAALLVGAILLFFTSVHVIIPFVLFAIGLIPFMSIEAVEIDYDQRKIRKIVNLIVYKHGEWMPLDDFDKLVLGATRESFKMIMPAHPLFQRDINIRAYDIYIINSINPAKTFLFLSCNNIPEAQRKLEEYSIKLDIEMIDTIRQGWENIRERMGG